MLTLPNLTLGDLVVFVAACSVIGAIAALVLVACICCMAVQSYRERWGKEAQ